MIADIRAPRSIGKSGSFQPSDRLQHPLTSDLIASSSKTAHTCRSFPAQRMAGVSPTTTFIVGAEKRRMPTRRADAAENIGPELSSQTFQNACSAEPLNCLVGR